LVLALKKIKIEMEIQNPANEKIIVEINKFCPRYQPLNNN
jgi:hypothetical protein